MIPKLRAKTVTTVTSEKVKLEVDYVNRKSKKGKEKLAPHPIYVRLKESLQAKTDKQLTQMLEVTKQSVNGWKRTGKIKRERLESVAQLTGVSLGWLLTGQGAKFLTKKSEQSVMAERVDESPKRQVTKNFTFQELPVTSELTNHQLLTTKGARTMTIPQRFCTDASQLIEIKSNDWEAEGFFPGDVLIAEPINGHVPEGRLIVAEANGQAFIRKIELRGDMAHFPAHNDGPAFSLLKTEVKILYVVTATIHPER